MLFLFIDSPHKIQLIISNSTERNQAMIYEQFTKEFEALKERVYGKTKTFTIINTAMKITLLKTNVTHGKRQYILITKILNLDVALDLIKEIRQIVEKIKKTYSKYYEPIYNEIQDRYELNTELLQQIDRLKDYASVKIIKLI